MFNYIECIKVSFFRHKGTFFFKFLQYLYILIPFYDKIILFYRYIYSFLYIQYTTRA